MHVSLGVCDSGACLHLHVIKISEVTITILLFC